MTERLARDGKSGAEQLVTTISDVFTALLAATDDGGDVLKFGGDALLIFYGSDDHARRACHAAQGMQRALRSAGRLSTPRGPVRLRMSVGMHSGRFPFLLIGREHLELVVTGPAATATVTMESRADAGEVLLSPATAALVPPAVLGPAREGGVLLGRVPAMAPIGAAATPDRTTADVERFVPKLLRGRLGPETAEHDHRHVTVSFLHAGGVDDLLTAEGLEETFGRLQALAEVVEEVTTDLDVCVITTDIGADGVKYYLAAGAPDSGDDDEGRMLRVCRRILDANVGLPLRAGVNRGHVFGGDVGTPWRRTYSVMGDTVNLAARLMGKAPVGGLLAHRSVVERSRTRFAFEPVPPFTVKGKARPVDAVLVGRVEVGAAERTSHDLPLAGREAELEAITAALAAAEQGRGRVVEVVGDTGMGKSRLAVEAARRTALARLSVACDPLDSGSPYYASRLLLRKALGIPLRAGEAEAGSRLLDWLGQHAPEQLPWAPLVAVAAGASVPETPAVADLAVRFRRARMQTAVDAVLAAAIGPALVVLEDAHWMDEASAAVLRPSLVAAAGRPWAVVLTRRDTGQGLLAPAEAVVLHLEPLTAEQSLTLLAAAVRETPVPPARYDAILHRAGGNPLFLLELVSAAATSDRTLPDTLEGMLAARIDALPPESRQALRYVSSLGTRFSSRVLDRALGDLGLSSDDGPLWDDLRPFVGRDGSGFAFRNDVYREVAYEGLTFARRRDLHARIADVYAALSDTDPREHASLLSLHSFLAQRFDDAWRFSRLAGDSAAAASAPAEAAEFYRRALAAGRHLNRLPDEALREVATAMGDACEVAGLYVQARQAYAEARRHCRGDGDEADVCRRRGILAERMGSYSQALRWYGKGERLAGQVDERSRRALVAGLSAGRAAARYRQGRFRECRAAAERAVAEAGAAGDRATLAHAHYLLGLALMLGDGDRQSHHFETALSIYEDLHDLVGQANVLNNLGIRSYYAGDWPGALASYRRSHDARLRAGDVVGAATAANNIGEILSDQLRLAEAEELFHEALSAWHGVDYPLGVALATSNLGRAAGRRGDPDTARRLLDTALASFERLKAEQFVVETRTRLLELERPRWRPGGSLGACRRPAGERRGIAHLSARDAAPAPGHRAATSGGPVGGPDGVGHGGPACSRGRQPPRARAGAARSGGGRGARSRRGGHPAARPPGRGDGRGGDGRGGDGRGGARDGVTPERTFRGVSRGGRPPDRAGRGHRSRPPRGRARPARRR